MTTTGGRAGAVAIRWAAGLLLLGALELYIGRAYIVRGTEWHYIVHNSIGVGLGLAGGGVVAAIRRRPTNGLGWALVGQLASVMPDLIFGLLRIPHQRWMDVFVGHISVHTAPGPLYLGIAVLLLGGWGWLAAVAGGRAVGAALGTVAIAVLVVALALHRPLPTHIADYRNVERAHGVPDGAFWCR